MTHTEDQCHDCHDTKTTLLTTDAVDMHAASKLAAAIRIVIENDSTTKVTREGQAFESDAEHEKSPEITSTDDVDVQEDELLSSWATKKMLDSTPPESASVCP